jgi:hypothetical protein
VQAALIAEEPAAAALLGEAPAELDGSAAGGSHTRAGWLRGY